MSPNGDSVLKLCPRGANSEREERDVAAVAGSSVEPGTQSSCVARNNLDVQEEGGADELADQATRVPNRQLFGDGLMFPSICSADGFESGPYRGGASEDPRANRTMRSIMTAVAQLRSRVNSAGYVD
ncbi:hypothetical protein BS78_06G043800 [Paspalum vaginatum]|nr:hypothetical protein BS78_06G043800 [Paspalum vaginatum]